jgi:hypothetical protein
MFGSSGAHDLGYANAAIIIALFRRLIADGVISKDTATEILDEATSTLEPFAHHISIEKAMGLVPEVKRQINKP